MRGEPPLTGPQSLDQASLLLYVSHRKAPGTCAAVEVIGCLVGLSGLGVMLAGNVGLGVALLVGYWVWVPLFGCLGMLSMGLLFVPIPLWWVLAAYVAAQAARSFNEDLARRLAEGRAP